MQIEGGLTPARCSPGGLLGLGFGRCERFVVCLDHNRRWAVASIDGFKGLGFRAFWTKGQRKLPANGIGTKSVFLRVIQMGFFAVSPINRMSSINANSDGSKSCAGCPW